MQHLLRGVPLRMTSARRLTSERMGPRLSWALSGVATAVWIVVVTSSSHWGRVTDHWEAAVTMLFGSFLAGSSPEGGGAVAFPVFTKALHVSAPAARTFGLCIQAVGMTMAAVSIWLCRRPIHRRATVVAVPAAIAGFVFAVALLGLPDDVFWPSRVPSSWVKATFSIVLATTSVLMVRHLKRSHDPERRHQESDNGPWTSTHQAAIAVVAFAGGVLSSLTGTGANILVFLFLVVIVGTNPKVALPSAIVTMAAVSIVGLVVFGVVDGQLDIAVAGDEVVGVGGEAVALAASEADIYGLWMAAVPIVGLVVAPLGVMAAQMAVSRPSQ